MWSLLKQIALWKIFDLNWQVDWFQVERENDRSDVRPSLVYLPPISTSDVIRFSLTYLPIYLHKKIWRHMRVFPNDFWPSIWVWKTLVLLSIIIIELIRYPVNLRYSMSMKIFVRYDIFGYIFDTYQKVSFLVNYQLGM